MSATWWQEWPCKCQRRDPVFHKHYADHPRHPCARCGACEQYEPDIPEHVAIRILLGPEMSDAEAATVLLGPA